MRKSLMLWYHISPFMNITHIDNHDKYRTEMDDFESNVRKFYSVGGKSFLTKRGSTGDDETFYMHVLRYYIIMIARKIFRKHTLGVGIYTMQGYERRNKELKNFYVDSIIIRAILWQQI